MFGTQFQLPVRLVAGIFLVDDPTLFGEFGADPSTLPDPYSYVGSANFFDSVVLIGATVTDTSHDPISGTTISSLSGFNYAAVPEPQSLPLLITAAGALFILRWRKYSELNNCRSHGRRR
jgi:hypothetical protein